MGAVLWLEGCVDPGGDARMAPAMDELITPGSHSGRNRPCPGSGKACLGAGDGDGMRSGAYGAAKESTPVEKAC